MGLNSLSGQSKLHFLRPPKGSSKRPKRVGRGSSSGHGKTCGRGNKGHLARTGGSTRPGFEGGQMPLIRRLPKRGFCNRFKKIWAEVNISDLRKFLPGEKVNPQKLVEAGIVKGKWFGIKVLGMGDISYPLTVEAHAFSAQARKKIESVGGRVVLLTGGKV